MFASPEKQSNCPVPSPGQTDWQGDFSLIKELWWNRNVSFQCSLHRLERDQKPKFRTMFSGEKEENVSWNLSLDLAHILEHISCYENCRNTFKWASHECPWSSAVNWKSQRQNLLKEKSLKLGREGQVILESHLLSGSLCLQHEAVTTCFVLLSQIQDVTLAKS